MSIFDKNKFMRLLTLLIISAILLCSCGNTTAPKFIHSKNDTFKTIGLYRWGANYIRSTIIFIMVKDSFKFVSEDTLTQRKKWIRDSIIFIPYTDTLRDKGKPVFDSLGKVKFLTQWIPDYPKQYLYGFIHTNIDSLIKKDSVQFEPTIIEKKK